LFRRIDDVKDLWVLAVALGPRTATALRQTRRVRCLRPPPVPTGRGTSPGRRNARCCKCQAANLCDGRWTVYLQPGDESRSAGKWRSIRRLNCRNERSSDRNLS
jgi:hypothetical protein